MTFIEINQLVVSSFNPSEKYESNWIISPSDSGENQKIHPQSLTWNLEMMGFS